MGFTIGVPVREFNVFKIDSRFFFQFAAADSSLAGWEGRFLFERNSTRHQNKALLPSISSSKERFFEVLSFNPMEVANSFELIVDTFGFASIDVDESNDNCIGPGHTWINIVDASLFYLFKTRSTLNFTTADQKSNKTIQIWKLLPEICRFSKSYLGFCSFYCFVREFIFLLLWWKEIGHWLRFYILAGYRTVTWWLIIKWKILSHWWMKSENRRWFCCLCRMGSSWGVISKCTGCVSSNIAHSETRINENRLFYWQGTIFQLKTRYYVICTFNRESLKVRLVARKAMEVNNQTNYLQGSLM